MLNEYIQLIKCFDRDSQYYWINRLNIADSVKGYLITYFKV